MKKFVRIVLNGLLEAGKSATIVLTGSKIESMPEPDLKTLMARICPGLELDPILWRNTVRLGKVCYIDAYSKFAEFMSINVEDAHALVTDENRYRLDKIVFRKLLHSNHEFAAIFSLLHERYMSFLEERTGTQPFNVQRSVASELMSSQSKKKIAACQIPKDKIDDPTPVNEQPNEAPLSIEEKNDVSQHAIKFGLTRTTSPFTTELLRLLGMDQYPSPTAEYPSAEASFPASSSSSFPDIVHAWNQDKSYSNNFEDSNMQDEPSRMMITCDMIENARLLLPDVDDSDLFPNEMMDKSKKGKEPFVCNRAIVSAGKAITRIAAAGLQPHLLNFYDRTWNDVFQRMEEGTITEAAVQEIFADCIQFVESQFASDSTAGLPLELGAW
eukprot:CAMPEP_0196595252 /NCGR_PEP_ID=MMETSP1081-20130531/80604_1 /TAXON_ID=36882 /ORGANISM="Pyramimonas amylifera, Strain CCMP720" /LENGTH=384 /DNA_ID=CAMNT_0041919763 /DNA_START=294 /DNA_END=1445 /DNA_ORIENTATION=+